MNFTKMHGTGNDFIVIEDLDGALEIKQDEIAKKLCERRFSIGADGVLFVRKSSIADIRMEIINADGSYAAMCGNGIRCFAKYVFDSGIAKGDSIRIETGDGIKVAHLDIVDSEVNNITINMGNYSLKPKDIPANVEEEIVNKIINVNGKDYKATSMLMGVPHTVIMCNLDEVDVEEGKYIEKYSIYTQGTNVNFCEVLDSTTIKVKTWERGAGPTLACGTGSCAAVIAANILDYTESGVKVIVPGGVLYIKIQDKEVLMTGPAVTVYEGKIEI